MALFFAADYILRYNICYIAKIKLLDCRRDHSLRHRACYPDRPLGGYFTRLVAERGELPALWKPEMALLEPFQAAA